MKRIISIICVLAMLIMAVPQTMAEFEIVLIDVTTPNTANVFYDNEIAKFHINLSGIDDNTVVEYNIYFKNYDDDNYKEEILPELVKSVKSNSVSDEIFFDLKDEKYGLYDFEVLV